LASSLFDVGNGRLLWSAETAVYDPTSSSKEAKRVADALVKKDKAAREASAAAVVPVKHTIRIEAAK
ncbi:MAG: hypothetical protein NTX87_16600, partial [Planctomycetota bacterium]|nr:hypothetical protein [Planctomycetota bacterium]